MNRSRAVLIYATEFLYWCVIGMIDWQMAATAVIAYMCIWLLKLWNQNLRLNVVLRLFLAIYETSVHIGITRSAGKEFAMFSAAIEWTTELFVTLYALLVISAVLVLTLEDRNRQSDSPDTITTNNSHGNSLGENGYTELNRFDTDDDFSDTAPSTVTTTTTAVTSYELEGQQHQQTQPLQRPVASVPVVHTPPPVPSISLPSTEGMVEPGAMRNNNAIAATVPVTTIQQQQHQTTIAATAPQPSPKQQSSVAQVQFDTGRRFDAALLTPMYSGGRRMATVSVSLPR